MHVLVTTLPAGGHLRPMVSVAQHAARLGHRVAVCAPATAKAEVEAYGLEHLPAGHDWVGEQLAEDALAEDLPADHPERVREHLITDGYPGAEALRTARDVIAHAGCWRPDVIVRGTCEFGGYLAAEALGLPHASVGTGGGNADYLDLARLAPALDSGRAALGLPSDPRGTRVYAYLHATLAPVAYDPREMRIPNTRCYRHASAEALGERLPAWVTELEGPLVFVAFGTMNPLMTAWDATTRAVVAGLGELGCTAVVAAGPRHVADPPPNVRLVERISQPLLLECCDLFVNHGGFNSVREALRHGVPMVIIPWMTDSGINADRCARAGLARVIPRDLLTPATLRSACAEVLGDPRYRASARRMRRHMLALPPLHALIDDLEQLVGH